MKGSEQGDQMSNSNGEMKLDSLFTMTTKTKASDLHVKVGKPPLLRIQGVIRALETPPLTHEDTQRLLLPIMSEEQRKHLDKLGGIDFAHTVQGLGRFRVNVYRQRGSLSMAARRVNTEIPSFDELHLPPVMAKIASYQQGLIIISGVTGSGKSTSLAAMLDHINETRRCHIVTIEDPIEYLLTDKKAFVNQREVGIDVPSFKVAMKHVVRQDPDVILRGRNARRGDVFGGPCGGRDGAPRAGDAALVERIEHVRKDTGVLPAVAARADKDEPRVQPEGDHLAEAAAVDKGRHRPGTGDGSDDNEPDHAQAHQGPRGQQDTRRDQGRHAKRG